MRDRKRLKLESQELRVPNALSSETGVTIGETSAREASSSDEGPLEPGELPPLRESNQRAVKDNPKQFILQVEEEHCCISVHTPGPGAPHRMERCSESVVDSRATSPPTDASDSRSLAVFASDSMEGLAKKRYEQAQLHILQVTDLVEPAPTIQKHLTEMLSATAPTFRHASADALMRRGLVLARALATKADVFHGCMETVDEEQLYVQMLAAYVCSHIIRAQAVVEAHNLGLAQRTNVSITDNDWDQYRDRGLNRARVLILAPTRHVAYAFMHALVACLRPRQLGNIQRFEDEFGPSASDGTVSEDPTTLLVPPFEPVPEKEADTPRAQHWRSKPRDYRAAMKGNIDDDFRLGVRMARRSIHFFADFMDSDVIVASPLGLQRVLDDPEKGGPKGGAADPFSSIEIAIVLRAHVILMQNWDHALQLFQEAVNSMPVHLPTKTDFSRVEQRFLDGNAAAYRQDIILSAFDVPQMHAWFRLARRQGVENVSGVLKILRTWHPGVLSDVRSTLSTAKRSASSARVRHLFQRIALPSSQIVRPSKERASTCPGIQTEEHRFEEFAKRWLPKVVKSSQTHILIYVPSYFDFVRVRNLFRQWLERRIFPVSEIRYAACSEYTKPQDVSRNRLAFYEGRVRFLIITERFHFYHRYRLRGVRNVYFYSVPQCASFYAEIVERLESAGSSFRQSNTLFALPNDAIALHRIIGSRNFRYIASNPLRLEFAFFAERGTRL